MKLSPFIRFSLALHLLLSALLLARPDWWPALLAVFVLDHLALGLAGMWPQSTLLGANITRLPPDAAARREVAITIDDGPDPAVTPQVLEILAAHGAQASFFCIGERAGRHPELVRAMAAAGHAVENHGLQHRNHLAFSGFGGWRREVAGAQQILAALAGTPPRFYRALAGLRNPFLDPVLQSLGLRLATWSRRGFDTRCRDADEVVRRLLQGLEPGAILLLHDGHAARDAAGQPIILAVLPRLLEALAVRGLTPVTLRSALP